MTLSYNQAQYLQRCIDSIVAQTGPPWELIIVDPGSTDDSESIYERYTQDSRIRLHREPDDGPADGLNNGLRLARGALFGYLNADDMYMHRRVFEEVEEEFARRRDASAVVANGYQIDARGRVVRELLSDAFSARSYVLGVSVCVQQSTFFRTTAVRNVGGFNPRNRISWDGELLFDLSVAGLSIVHCPQHWGAFRIYPGTITSDPSTTAAAGLARDRLFHRLHGRHPDMLDSTERIVRRFTRDLRSPAKMRARIFSKIAQVEYQQHWKGKT